MKFEVGQPVDYTKLHWYSDWNGYEVGYDHIPVVGLYGYEDVYCYIDTEHGTILESWTEKELDDLWEDEE